MRWLAISTILIFRMFHEIELFHFKPVLIFFREISFGSSRDGDGRVPGEQEIIELGRKIDKTYVFDRNFRIFVPG